MVHVVQNTQNWVISVVVLQRTARKCTKISNARAELLFCSLSLLFGDVLVAVAVVVCVSSLITSCVNELDLFCNIKNINMQIIVL